MEVLKQELIHIQKDVESLRKDLDKNELMNSKNHKEIYSSLEGLKIDLNIVRVHSETSLSMILTKINELSSDIKGIKEKPAKRWELIVTTIVTALIAAGLTYLGVQ